MVTFSVALALLMLGYLVYGGFVNRVFAPDAKRTTPAVANNDGVDYIPMPTWKIFMIQFLNIAGLGPIFGAIMGAQFGTASYLWIVIGTIFAGAVHDFFSGCLSIRNNGANLPELIGKYLGTSAKTVMNVLSIVLMVLVGAVFVSGPAELLAGMTPAALNVNFWIIAIFLYYILATLLPIDKIIGRIYPLFAIALLFMAFGILIMLYVKSPQLPEMWEGFGTKYEKTPIFPMMFVSIACGAISGFHATQSPLMARCMKSERHCRPIFYGAMVTEGIVALIWAAAATWFFGEHGTAPSEASWPSSASWRLPSPVATLLCARHASSWQTSSTWSNVASASACSSASPCSSSPWLRSSIALPTLMASRSSGATSRGAIRPSLPSPSGPSPYTWCRNASPTSSPSSLPSS